MSILTILLVVCVAGLIAWAINALPMIDPLFKRIATVVLVVCLVLRLLSIFFDLGSLPTVGHVKGLK